MESTEWFYRWFNSPWYHILYSDHDENEAITFAENLCKLLDTGDLKTILDLACGKGRYAAAFHQLGFSVTGIDLSEKSIAYAQTISEPGLKFVAGDMREAVKCGKFDLVLNMFTSFGYFSTEEENVGILSEICDCLNPNGYFLLDYLNLDKCRRELVEHEEVVKNGILFNIHRRISDNYISKSISFEADGQQQDFKEQVFMFEAEELIEHMKHSGFKILGVFGDYALQEFDKDDSERLILLGQKI